MRVIRTISAAVLAFAVLFAPPVAASEAADATEIDPFLQPVESADAPTDDWSKLQRRRTILKWHQGFALTTLGLLLGQAAVGQVLLSAQKGNFAAQASTQDNLKYTHLGLGLTAFSTYWTAAGLALAAPDIERDRGFDSLSLHKLLAWGHGAGMALTPMLGIYISSQSSNPNPPVDLGTLKTVHQAAGYATTGLLAGAFLVITFDVPKSPR